MPRDWHSGLENPGSFFARRFTLGLEHREGSGVEPVCDGSLETRTRNEPVPPGYNPRARPERIVQTQMLEPDHVGRIGDIGQGKAVAGEPVAFGQYAVDIGDEPVKAPQCRRERG